ERTEWVRRVIPCFEALSHTTNMVRFFWCEATVTTTVANMIEANDNISDLRRAKKADGIGATPNNMESLLMESSAGRQEDVPHSLGDTKKIMQMCVHSLKNELLQHKEASIGTAMRRAVIGIHYIVDRLTLTTTSLMKDGDVFRWKHIQLRSAVIPMSWSNRYQLTKVCELMATVFACLLKQQLLDEVVAREGSGLETVDEMD
ncbi:hypothetical protein DFS34DRAFT_565460, partial [Phlyctochytrium arcticum]